MYNLRSISNVLVRAPLNAHGDSGKFAGPPFTVTYTLGVPMGEINRWLAHQDL